MTDMGTHRSMQDGSHPSNRLQMLRRIAEALDRPVSDFYRYDTPAAEPERPSADECEQLLAAFLRVRDADARTRIIDMLRAYSGN